MGCASGLRYVASRLFQFAVLLVESREAGAHLDNALVRSEVDAIARRLYALSPKTPEVVADRVRLCLKHAPAGRLAFSTDCGLSQTARWASKQKLANLVAGVEKVRKEVGV